MLDKESFDLLAEDKDGIWAENDTYPYAGYKTMLSEIRETILSKPNWKWLNILDLGIGLSPLSKALEDKGLKMSSVDMKTNKEKDFTMGFPLGFEGKKFDLIVSTYAFHHILNPLKPLYLKYITNFLKASGTFIIADLAFESQEDWKNCKASYSTTWDDAKGQHYFIHDKYKELLENNFEYTYKQMSLCSGLLTLKPKGGEEDEKASNTIRKIT